MVYRKAVYQVVKGEMVEVVAESVDEFWELCNDGWHDHPETARNSVVSIVETVKKLEDMDRKELCEFADTLGIDIDKRKSKLNMLAELQKLID